MSDKKLFDFKNINRDTVYVGNIMLVKKVNKKHLKECLNADIIIGDLSGPNGPCKTDIAKKDAILVKVSDNYYVDIDSIKDLQDCDYINFCLKNNISDNILLKKGTFDPYVGQLFVSNLKKCITVEKSINIKKLKLLNNKK